MNEEMQEKNEYLTDQTQSTKEKNFSLQRLIQYKEEKICSLQQSFQFINQIDHDTNNVPEEDAQSAPIAKYPQQAIIPTSTQTTLNSKQTSNQSKILSLER